MAEIWMDVDTALSEVPVNIFPLTDDTDFKTRETAVAYDAAGVDLVWNFVTTAGVYTQTAVTPTTSGNYDWTHQGDGMYSIEIPASGGASINNDTEGFGWFSGVATGVLPWRGPIIGFRAAALNNALIDGGDTLDVNVTEFGGSAGTFASGRPEVNASHWGGTAVASATVRSDLINIAGVAVSTSTAQLGVNVVNFGGSAGTFSSGRPEVNASHISGSSTAADNVEVVYATDFATNYSTSNDQWNVSTSAVASVTGAVGSVTSSVTVGTNNDKTGYSLTATTGLGNQTANITGNLSGSVGSVSGGVGGSVAGNVNGSVGSVSGNVGGNVVGSVGSVTGNVGGSIGSLATQAKTDVNDQVAAALVTYDPPTRTEAIADKDEILTQLPAAPAKNTAFTYVIKMVDATDGMTPETGLTVTMTRSIDGAAFASATGTVTEISTGHYKVAASAADMNGDVVAHRFTASGAADLSIVWKTVS